MTSLLAAQNLSYAYDRSSAILQDWSASFDRGEMVAITGPSGRGKSTLLYLLGLMLKPSSGSIEVDGIRVTGQSDAVRAHLRATRFGFVFQDSALDSSRTVLDNVVETSLYRGSDRRAALVRARQLLETFGVSLREQAKPGEISGGQAQRIALCRALLARPSIVLADEPTGNLDPQTGDIVIQALREEAQEGAAVIIVTHEPSVVLRCDREVVL